ncbi:MAG: SHOCT-like domain-containing protein [Bacteroidota bacterium]
MTNRTLSTGPRPRIVLETVAGDLSVVGWEGEAVSIRADEDALRLTQDGERVLVSCTDDLSLRVPRQASLVIQNVGGDMALRAVEGDLEIGQLGGDASIREISSATIASIRSDLSLRAARGNLSIKSVGGDASIREVQGSLLLESVGDDLVLRDVRGDLEANAGEDVVISLSPQPGRKYVVNAGDDIMLVLPSDADATLTLSADEIYVNWPGVPSEDGAASRTITLGKGAASVALSAGGELRVSSQERAQGSPEEFGNFAGMMFDWSEFGSQLGVHISRSVEQATRRAAEQAERAARRAEAKLRSRSRGRVNMGRWDWNIDSSSITPPAPREPVSEEERLAILKMLAEKKITAAEADKLLAALEGGQ